ncbi:MAG TPA: c-type cytochrome [Candidatus Bathyarchaeia archaeon]|nr:c-type cytochrome [Candidatus Bathyarchaeia archaeon]
MTGEDFPPPAAPGPDLTGVGAHHPPGYLLESILNPDADEPGYTDARGHSTMPDFTGRLSVTDLVDLVAYLQALSGSPGETSRSSK